MSSPLVEEGVAALRDGDAAAARRAFELALAEVESGEALEGLAKALYLEQEYEASAAHYERAYVAYRRERNPTAAGRAAMTSSWIAGNVLGDWAVRNGWLARSHHPRGSRRGRARARLGADHQGLLGTGCADA